MLITHKLADLGFYVTIYCCPLSAIVILMASISSNGEKNNQSPLVIHRNSIKKKK